MAPPLLTLQMLTLYNTLPESDHAPSAQALPLPNAGGDQNMSQKQKATFEVVKWLQEAIIVTTTCSPVLSNHKYSMVDKAWKHAFEGQDCQQVLAGVPVGTTSGCELPSGPSLEINPQTWVAVRFWFCSILLLQIYNIDYTPKYT